MSHISNSPPTIAFLSEECSVWDVSLPHTSVSFITCSCGARIQGKWESSYQWEGKQGHLFLRSPRGDVHLSCPGSWGTEKRKILGEGGQGEGPQGCTPFRKQQTATNSWTGQGARHAQLSPGHLHGWEGWCSGSVCLIRSGREKVQEKKRLRASRMYTHMTVSPPILAVCSTTFLVIKLLEHCQSYLLNTIMGKAGPLQWARLIW